MTVLDIEDLRVRFDTDQGPIHAVNGVSLSVAEGETVAVVGESGSGKSVTALAVMGLLPKHGVVEGAIRLRGEDLLAGGEAAMRDVRGRRIAMVHQDPMTALNPVLTVGRQLTMPLRHHLGLDRREAKARAIEHLDLVGIPRPDRRIGDYPHQFSGGQRQRILLAMALSCEPSVLVADEPTTALDVTTQAQILALVEDLRQRIGAAIVWITHDLGVVAGLADRVMVMYGGTVVERAGVDALFERPHHPYTTAMLGSLPQPGSDARLASIPGSPPRLRQPPSACPFTDRCERVRDDCRRERPPLRQVADDHAVACLHPTGRESR